MVGKFTEKKEKTTKKKEVKKDFLYIFLSVFKNIFDFRYKLYEENKQNFMK